MKKIATIAIASIIFITGCQNKQVPTVVDTQTQTKAEAMVYDKTIKSWGQGNNVNDKNQPVACLDYEEKYGELGAKFINSGADKKIMLTFDEGYEQGYTSQILDTLKEKNVRAVFFITGDYLERSEDLVKRMNDEGQIIGNHTQNHPSMPTLTRDEIKEEINSLGDQVNDKLGISMNMLRPPKGEFSQESLATTKECGYSSVFWSVAYEDWKVDAQPDKNKALKTLESKLHDGAIYLLHGVSKTNAQILGDFIDLARDKGYEFTLFVD